MILYYQSDHVSLRGRSQYIRVAGGTKNVVKSEVCLYFLEYIDSKSAHRNVAYTLALVNGDTCL